MLALAGLIPLAGQTANGRVPWREHDLETEDRFSDLEAQKRCSDLNKENRLRPANRGSLSDLETEDRHTQNEK